MRVMWSEIHIVTTTGVFLHLIVICDYLDEKWGGDVVFQINDVNVRAYDVRIEK